MPGKHAVVTEARVDLDDGRAAATITLVPTGGGVQVKTVDGQPEEVIHPAGEVYHVRCLSPDRMVPDTLTEADSFEAAERAACAYAAKLEKHAAALADFAPE